MIEPVADAIAAPATKLFLAERHPELTQITQLVEQQRARLLPAREHPSDLTMRQAEIEWGTHKTHVIIHLIVRKRLPRKRPQNSSHARSSRIPNLWQRAAPGMASAGASSTSNLSWDY